MVDTILLSPTEHDLAEKMKDDAITSSEPEKRGADVLIYSKHGVFGMQRKHLPGDFLASIEDGRLTRELALMLEKCTFNRLVVEGHPDYWFDGTITLGWQKVGGKRMRIASKYTKDHLLGMFNDIELIHQTIIKQTDDLDDTVRYIKSIQKYLKSSSHMGLYRRPSAKGVWNRPSSKDIHLWVMQSFPGVGPTTADAIINHFGRVPLKWVCTADELSKVRSKTKKGDRVVLNIKEAKALIKYLDNSALEYIGKNKKSSDNLDDNNDSNNESNNENDNPEQDSSSSIISSINALRARLKGTTKQ